MNELEPSQIGSDGVRLSAPQISTATPLPTDTVSVARSEPQSAIEAPPAKLQAEPSSAAVRPTSETSAPASEPETQGHSMFPVEGQSMPGPTVARVYTREISIAFDGACKGNPGRGDYGAILINTRTGAEKIVKGREASTTNNQMELTAAIAGLNALRPGAVVTMLGDSQYVIKGATEWLPGWKARGWKADGGKPVANKELWQSLKMAVARHESVTWERVKGHPGDTLNERVDRIVSGEADKAHSM